MTTIGVNDRDKDRFEDFQDPDETHAEAFSRAMDIVEAFEGEPVDVEKLADELEHSLLSNVEIAAHRGVKSALESKATE